MSNTESTLACSSAVDGDGVTLAQLPYIAKIIQDEMWLEGERRGGPVDARDPVVTEKVCTILIELGGSIRELAARARAGCN